MVLTLPFEIGLAAPVTDADYEQAPTAVTLLRAV
jgi:hypothetical protein